MEEQIEEFLTRGVAEVIEANHLRKRLLSGKKLRVKFGIDPTSPNLHLGRSVPLLKLRDLQRLGHHIIFLVGDFTAVIGDTSDKDSERPMLMKETVQENMRLYLDQAAKILDMSTVEVYYNSTGLARLGYEEICEQANNFSVAEFIARDNVRKRLDAGKRVSLREVLYPLMQGYDSVSLHADVELGGIDQRFNLLAGRTIQSWYGQSPQDIVLMNIIAGVDGRKMSSSWGNTINFSDTSREMFGKVMSISDDSIVVYMIHCTRIPLKEIAKISEGIVTGMMNPRDAKIQLAKEIVTIYHGEQEASEAERYFIETFSKKEIPQDVRKVSVKVGEKYRDVLVAHALAESKGDARRKIEQGGVSLEGNRLLVDAIVVEADIDKVLKVGKKDFVRLELSNEE